MKFYVLENHPNDSRVKIRESGIFQTLSSRMGTGGGNVPMIMEEDMQERVRRLTPIECERLQCLPDNYTADGIDENGNIVKMSDSARYKMIGNGMAQPCADFIIRRIVEYTIKNNNLYWKACGFIKGEIK